MTRVTLVIEQLPDGSVIVVSDPGMDTLIEAARHRPLHQIPVAQALAVVAWEALLQATRELAKTQGRKQQSGHASGRMH